MSVVKRQTIEILSSSRDQGSTCDYSVHIPDGAIACAPDQHLRVSLAQFMCFNPFFNVTAENSRFIIALGSPNYDPLTNSGASVIVVALPPGTYRFRELARAINAQTQPQVTCAFDAQQNGFVFSSLQSFSLHFFGTSWKLLGFDYRDALYGKVISSTQVIDPQPFRTINISMDGVTAGGNINYSNARGNMKATTTLMSMAVGRDVKPFDNIVYTAPSDGLFGVHILEKVINELHIRVTDHNGVGLTDLPEHSLLLQVEVIDSKDGAQDTLVQVRDLLARQLELTRLQLLVNKV